MEVLYADPRIESMLAHHVVAEVPLAEVSAVVIIANQPCDGTRICRQRYVVAMQPNGVRVQPRHDAGAARCADGLRYVCVLEDVTVIGNRVEVRSLNPVVSITCHGVLPLLVGQDEEDVRTACRVGHGA